MPANLRALLASGDAGQRSRSPAGSPDGGHELRQRVYFEDTDFSGRVYHARYLQFMERGRSDYLRLLGIHHRELAEDGLSFAVSRMEIDFRRPATIDDVLTIGTAASAVTGARIVLRQTIFRGDEPLVEAAVTVALVGAGGRPLRLPERIRARLGVAEIKTADQSASAVRGSGSARRAASAPDSA